VLVGFGRTGTWFGVDHDGVVPDLMVFAKGVNSGYVPLGGVLVSEPIYEAFTKRPYPAGMTYSGHPLACAAAVGAIGAMDDEGTEKLSERLEHVGTDQVLAFLRVTFHRRTSGITAAHDAPTANVNDLVDRKLNRITLYPDRQAALEAVGLRQ
jgi:adenosylmethionine-8-amino-7-oxononanoate aminotransferase